MPGVRAVLESVTVLAVRPESLLVVRSPLATVVPRETSTPFGRPVEPEV